MHNINIDFQVIVFNIDLRLFISEAGKLIVVCGAQTAQFRGARELILPITCKNKYLRMNPLLV